MPNSHTIYIVTRCLANSAIPARADAAERSNQFLYLFRLPFTDNFVYLYVACYFILLHLPSFNTELNYTHAVIKVKTIKTALLKNYDQISYKFDRVFFFFIKLMNWLVLIIKYITECDMNIFRTIYVEFKGGCGHIGKLIR